ncbi:PsiF family protein [Roseomonas sp. KE0001]|uniref:PsiF family protein n=1 Tax=Roseomonas sp. KE0001 TaxID=2479201 RepID=UPI0018E019B0|nr:PsiF family protein [Roseomonas sp. KE0001]MBI0432407.1 phosphate-starvation-inducible protein PsiF [Roseomonas sp. KE0001]
MIRILLLPALLAALALPGGEARAQRETPRQTSQQTRMSECNAGAGVRKLEGPERRQFMSDCLAGRVPPAPPEAGGGSSAQAAQRQRMSDCNATAGTRKLTGPARQEFMKSCLSGG